MQRQQSAAQASGELNGKQPLVQTTTAIGSPNKHAIFGATTSAAWKVLSSRRRGHGNSAAWAAPRLRWKSCRAEQFEPRKTNRLLSAAP